MAEVTESCPCGAVFRFKGFLLPEGLGEAVQDFRNRHATCRGKRVLRSQVGTASASSFQRMEDPYCAGHKHSPGPGRVKCDKCGRYKTAIQEASDDRSET